MRSKSKIRGRVLQVSRPMFSRIGPVNLGRAKKAAHPGQAASRERKQRLRDRHREMIAGAGGIFAYLAKTAPEIRARRARYTREAAAMRERLAELKKERRYYSGF